MSIGSKVSEFDNSLTEGATANKQFVVVFLKKRAVADGLSQ
jgi:hypothetical protein